MILMEGWIKLYKQVQDNVLWQDKPFSRGQAWIDLLLMANYADGEMLSKGTIVHIKRGQVFRTQKHLSERWGWSIKKVRGFLLLLEKQKMATVEGIAQGMLITVEKYEFFQCQGQGYGIQEGTEEGMNRATQGRQKKKNKEEKHFIPPSVEEVRQYCTERGNTVDPEAFVAHYASNGWMVGKNKMKQWKAAVVTWERRQQNDEKKSEVKLYG